MLRSLFLAAAGSGRLGRMAESVPVSKGIVRRFVADDAVRVVVLDHGRVVQAGPHDELIGVEGPYAVLWAAYAADALVD